MNEEAKKPNGMWENRFENFIIRKAAGTYWLVETGNYSDEYRQPLRCNEVGARIWEGLKSGLPPEQIVSEIADAYNVSQAEVRDDAELFLKQLSDYVS